jgi:hypothetical protein
MPSIEVSDEAYSIGIRGPDGERDSVHTVQREHVSAKLFIDPFMTAFAEQVEIDFA